MGIPSHPMTGEHAGHWRRAIRATDGDGCRLAGARMTSGFGTYIGFVFLFTVCCLIILGVGFFLYCQYIKFFSPDSYAHKRSDDIASEPKTTASKTSNLKSEPLKKTMSSVTPPRKGDYTPQQLVEHDGRDASKAVLLSLFGAKLHPICTAAAT